MTDRTQHCAGCRERQAEIDRLRILNETLRMQRDAARDARIAREQADD